LTKRTTSWPAARPTPQDPAAGHQSPSEQVHDPLGQTLLAQHDVQLAASGDPVLLKQLGDFYFIESSEREAIQDSNFIRKP